MLSSYAMLFVIFDDNFQLLQLVLSATWLFETCIHTFNKARLCICKNTNPSRLIKGLLEDYVSRDQGQVAWPFLQRPSFRIPLVLQQLSQINNWSYACGQGCLWDLLTLFALRYNTDDPYLEVYTTSGPNLWLSLSSWFQWGMPEWATMQRETGWHKSWLQAKDKYLTTTRFCYLFPQLCNLPKIHKYITDSMILPACWALIWNRMVRVTKLTLDCLVDAVLLSTSILCLGTGRSKMSVYWGGIFLQIWELRRHLGRVLLSPASYCQWTASNQDFSDLGLPNTVTTKIWK